MAACIHFLATFKEKLKYFENVVENVNKVAKTVPFYYLFKIVQVSCEWQDGLVVRAHCFKATHLF